MVVRSRTNQYRGINAHLHSYFQSESGWEAFHGHYITYMTSALQNQLYPMGYVAEAEQSLQIWHGDEPMGRPRSDVMIYDTMADRAAKLPKSYATSAGQLIVPMADVYLQTDLYTYQAIAIYELEPSDLGKPVAWIELLSPSNKVGSGARSYLMKRRALSETGVVLIELDYLHETPPMLNVVPVYPDDDESQPYRISIFEPRPDTISGQVIIQPFNVAESIPSMSIPLSDEDVIKFDFNAPYQRVFEDMLYGLRQVDYSQLPTNFERYSQQDQTYIANRMVAVMQADNLETYVPDSVFESLEKALEKIKGME